MAKQLTNNASVIGRYNNLDVDNTTQLIVELTSLDIQKTADKEIWVDGNLKYTITIKNMDNNIPGLPVTDIVVTDIIDTRVAEYVTDSIVVTVDGVVDPNPTFDYTDGTLTVNIDNLDAGKIATIEFEVESVL